MEKPSSALVVELVYGGSLDPISEESQVSGVPYRVTFDPQVIIFRFWAIGFAIRFKYRDSKRVWFVKLHALWHTIFGFVMENAVASLCQHDMME